MPRRASPGISTLAAQNFRATGRQYFVMNISSARLALPAADLKPFFLRKGWVTTIFLLLFCLLPGSSRSLAQPSGPRPNILLLLADDLGYGDLACFGNAIIQTPNLDRLARQGLRFTNAHSSSPVCSPSRAGLLTGRIPTRLGIHDWIPDHDGIHLTTTETTLATVLGRAGYQTAFFGKWHLNGEFNSARQPQPNDHGFSYWLGTHNNALPSHRNPTNFVRNGQRIPQTEGYACQLLADEVIGWTTRQRDPARPFFLHVCFHEPHEPVASPEELVRMYGAHTPPERATYYANVENLDRAVGRILVELDKKGLAENTLVLFTSDNGPETLNRYRGAERSYGSTGGLRGMKLHLYEGGTRVPMLLRWPGQTAAGRVSDELIWSLDFLPTLAAAAGVSPRMLPKTPDGQDLIPLLTGRVFRRKTPFFWYYHNALGRPKLVVQEGDWKLLGLADLPHILNRDIPKRAADLRRVNPTEYELFNVRTDPAEERNVAQEHPTLVRRLQAQMRRLYREALAEAPTWEGVNNPQAPTR